MSSPIFGIDLGTTNSCLALFDDGTPRLVPIEETGIVPSVVSLDGDEIVVGRRARNRALLAPDATVASIKREMGRSEPLRLGDREMLPEEIAAEILRYLKVEGSRILGRDVERAVITVPAYFEDEQRRATIRAGELAGLEVVRLINEPTAAALLYDRISRGDEELARDADALQRVLVYDLGGGTFDVSVVELAQDVDEVRASCGDNRLGGDDFDALLADHLRSLLLAQTEEAEEAEEENAGDDAAEKDAVEEDLDDPRLAARLLHAAESAKIDLSTHPYAQVAETAILGSRHLETEISRELFEELIDPLLERTLDEVDRALEEAEVHARAIDRVILVGGSTHIPRIRDLLDGRFPCPVEHTMDPAECVALGAAIQGAILDGRVFDHILVDVAPHTLGIKTLGHDERPSEADEFAPIIRRNSRIPIRRSEVFYTLTDEQELVHVEVFQGESPRCSDNTLIGEFEFELEPAPIQSPVVVDLAYDTDGIIRVEVLQKGADNRREVTLETRSRTPSAAAAAADADQLDNYILRKARSLAATLEDPAERRRLEEAAASYGEILADETADPDEVDRREDELLELLEEIEEIESADAANAE